MEKSGSKKNTGTRKGGIEKIVLAKTKWIEKIEYDYLEDRYTGIKLKDGCEFVNYNFIEDNAQYIENVKYQNGICIIEHKLEFSIPKINANSNNIVTELLKDNSAGVVAIIKTAAHEYFLIGVSTKFGTEKPLKIVSIQGKTGYKYEDEPEEKITLKSEDMEKTKYYNGELNTL